MEGTAYQLNDDWAQVLKLSEEELLGFLPVIAERAEEALGDFVEEAA